ncbi:MAG: glycosyltransferase family 4 protein [Bryobacteraceae bacterium]
MSYRLGVVTTHPIQYQVPWFRVLARRPDIDLTVFYSQIPSAWQQGGGFGVAFEWDVSLLDGYHYLVLPNVARTPSVTTFRGCDTPALYREIQRDRFDAVIVNGWVAKSCLQALWACRRAGVPCIVRGESNTFRKRAWWKSLIHRGLLRQYSAFLVIGNSNAAFYRSHGISPTRMFPGRYCVDSGRFSDAADRLRPQRNELRTVWGIPADVPVFLYCGKMIPKKHPLTLLRAAGLARAQGARFHLLLVGDGELRVECERFASEQQLPATFAGFINQTRIPEAYVAADCLVLPSDEGETWGLVVNEAMACGLPAIVSDRVGCGPDLIVAGETGQVFPFGNERDLARALLDLSSNRMVLERMGRSARKHVSAYSVEALAEGTLMALHYLCAAIGPTETVLT